MPCVDDLEQGQACAGEPCPAPECELSDWDTWSACTSYGQRFRQRQLTSPDAHLQCLPPSNHLELPLGETRPCVELTRRDCQASGWSDWEACDKTCGDGQQRRER